MTEVDAKILAVFVEEMQTILTGLDYRYSSRDELVSTLQQFKEACTLVGLAHVGEFADAALATARGPDQVNERFDRELKTFADRWAAFHRETVSQLGRSSSPPSQYDHTTETSNGEKPWWRFW